MKIELPGGQKKINNEPKRKAVDIKSGKTEKTESGRIRWRKRGNYVCASIKGQYVSICLNTFDAILSNGFKIAANSIENSKENIKDFLDYEGE
jgi:hypothetical protein